MQSSTEFARFNMIQQQIRPWDVLDHAVLDVMGELPRELFVPDAYRGLAYADVEIPLSSGAYMLAPKVAGRMLQALDVKPRHRVLEIGTGTGYVTACLCRLGAHVVSYELDPELASAARDRLAGLDLHHVEIREGDGLVESVPGSPFDAIVVKGSLPTEDLLPMLWNQLGIGGRLICVVGEDPVMECVLVTRVGKQEVRRVSLFETSVPALNKLEAPAKFEF